MSATFDAYADEYSAALAEGLRYSGEDGIFFARGRVEWLAGRLEELGERPRAVLDYGCGTGSVTPFLLEIAGVREVVGADISQRLLDVARNRHDSDRARFVHIDEPDEDAFDLAHCNGVFHHIAPEQRSRAIHYVWRALRPGGLFAFFENNPWNPGTQLVMHRIPFDRDAKKLSAPSARRLLLASGFDLVRTDFLFVFPAMLHALRKLEPGLARVPVGAQYLVLGRKPA